MKVKKTVNNEQHDSLQLVGNAEVKLLNETGVLLKKPNLGDKLLMSTSDESVSEFSISELENEISLIMDSFNEISSINEDNLGYINLKLCKDVLRKLEEWEKINNELNNDLLIEIEKMKLPLNEILAIFTPARWAYNDIELQVEGDKEKGPEIAINDKDGGRVDLRFNTAELNLFAVTLFLLLATKGDNQLSLLIFDDPLQNMDEMTVIALARGMGKLSKLLPGWQLLFLFHGLEDFERFRQEVPDAAAYRIPWLSPNDKEAEMSSIEKVCELDNTVENCLHFEVIPNEG